MLGAFAFEEAGRRYSCTPETRDTPPLGTWWWFTVSNDSQRYAPFEAAAGDSQQTVRARIVAWYEHRLWLRAQPAVPRERQGRFGKPGTAPAPAAAPPKKA